MQKEKKTTSVFCWSIFWISFLEICFVVLSFRQPNNLWLFTIRKKFVYRLSVHLRAKRAYTKIQMIRNYSAVLGAFFYFQPEYTKIWNCCITKCDFLPESCSSWHKKAKSKRVDSKKTSTRSNINEIDAVAFYGF